MTLGMMFWDVVLGRHFGTLFWNDITIFWDDNLLWKYSFLCWKRKHASYWSKTFRFSVSQLKKRDFHPKISSRMTWKRLIRWKKLLGQGVLHSKKLRVVFNRSNTGFKSKFALFGLAHGCVTPNNGTILRLALYSLEFAHYEGHKIGTHFGRLIKMAHPVNTERNNIEWKSSYLGIRRIAVKKKMVKKYYLISWVWIILMKKYLSDNFEFYSPKMYVVSAWDFKLLELNCQNK